MHGSVRQDYYSSVSVHLLPASLTLPDDAMVVTLHIYMIPHVSTFEFSIAEPGVGRLRDSETMKFNECDTSTVCRHTRLQSSSCTYARMHACRECLIVLSPRLSARALCQAR